MTCHHSDSRSGKVVFACHCLLNANAKVCGLAKYPGMLTELVSILADEDFGVIQLPCPEFIHSGPRRWWQVRSQYDTPAYRALCQRLAAEAGEQAAQYRAAGYRILGLLGIEGSPSCGVDEVYDAPDWGGKPGEVDLSGCRAEGSGIFIEILKDALSQGTDPIPCIGISSNTASLSARLAPILDSNRD